MKVSNEIPVPFDTRLNDDQRRAIRLKLDTACVRLLACRLDSFGGDPAELRRTFGFIRKMGIEAIIAQPSTDQSDIVAKLSKDFDIRVVPDDKAATSGTSPIYSVEASRGAAKAEITAAVERINQLSIQQAQKGQP
jgi:hypothetical protein